MSLERWIEGQQRRENLFAVSMGQWLLRVCGEVPLEDKTDFAAILRKEAKEYKRDPENPEIITAFWQAFWDKNGNKKDVDLKVEVPPCPVTREHLVALRKMEMGPIYVPEDVATQENRYLLGKMFSRMHGQSVRIEDNEVRNVESHSGWRLFNMRSEPLLLSTIEPEVRKAMEKGLADAPTLNEYIIAAQATKILTGKYLDEGQYYARLLGSMLSGDTIIARFFRSGELDVVPWPATRKAPRVGARFSWPAK